MGWKGDLLKKDLFSFLLEGFVLTCYFEKNKKQYQMGMVANFLRVEEELLERFIEDPMLLEEYVYGEHMNDLNASYFSKAELELKNKNQIDIDKSWDAINYLLGNKAYIKNTNNPHLLKSIMFSDQVVDPEQDLGYGPAQYTRAAQVKNVNKELTLLNEEDVMNTEDYLDERGSKLYVVNFDNKDELKYIIDNFILLKDFYNAASENGQAVLFYVS